MALRMASISFEVRATPGAYLLVPFNLLYLIVLSLGIGYAFKTGQLLPVIVLVTTGILLPYFNHSYAYPEATRYVGYLFPILYLLAAMPLVRATREVGKGPALARLYLGLGTAFLILVPALALYGYYAGQEAAGHTNVQVLAVTDRLRHQYQTGAISEVVIDRQLGADVLSGGGNVVQSVDYIFTLEGVPHHMLLLTPATLKGEMRQASSGAVGLVLGMPEYQALAGKVRLSALSPKLKNSQKGIQYQAYVAHPKP